MSRRDRVTAEIALAVLERDQGCLAPRLGGTAMDCWGRNTLAHVKDEARMARRAPSDPAHLITICQGHMEDGMRGGYIWVTDKRNIAAMREYLRAVMA